MSFQQHSNDHLYLNRQNIYIVTAFVFLVSISFIGYLLMSLDKGIEVETMRSCMGEIHGKSPDVALITQAKNLCYSSIGSQLLIDEEVIRRDNFVFQRHENVILLLMVVAITLSGVGLAGLQLFASYKLAVIGKGELSSGGELTYGKDNISFKSSVVGLVILAVSFGFFLVFVIDIYELKEGNNVASPGIPKDSQQTSIFIPFAPKFSLPPTEPGGTSKSGVNKEKVPSNLKP